MRPIITASVDINAFPLLSQMITQHKHRFTRTLQKKFFTPTSINSWLIWRRFWDYTEYLPSKNWIAVNYKLESIRNYYTACPYG